MRIVGIVALRVGIHVHITAIVELCLALVLTEEFVLNGECGVN